MIIKIILNRFKLVRSLYDIIRTCIGKKLRNIMIHRVYFYADTPTRLQIMSSYVGEIIKSNRSARNSLPRMPIVFNLIYKSKPDGLSLLCIPFF